VVVVVLAMLKEGSGELDLERVIPNWPELDESRGKRLLLRDWLGLWCIWEGWTMKPPPLERAEDGREWRPAAEGGRMSAVVVMSMLSA
jgi:hypothetical protein